jgi:hypothetical protein
MNHFNDETSRTRHNIRIDCDEQLSEDGISLSLSKTDTDSDKGETTQADSKQWTDCTQTQSSAAVIHRFRGGPVG